MKYTFIVKYTWIILALILAVWATPACADDLFIAGNGAAEAVDFPADGGIPVSLGFLQTASISFYYNTTSMSVWDITFTTQGVLGNNFSFAGVTDSGSVTNFYWSGPNGVIDMYFPDWFLAAAATNELPVPLYISSNVSLPCSTQACGGFVLPHPNPTGTEYIFQHGSSIISSVPEPSSLVLLAIGLLGSGFLTRRKLFSH